MSEAISKRIKQLENQNEKLRKLLDCTLQITSEEAAKCLSLKSEASFLKKVLSDLENQKRQLENELNLHIEQDYWIPDESAKRDNIENKLNKALEELRIGSSEVRNLNVEDTYLKALINDLEKEKEALLCDLNLVKKANEENNALAQENLKLRNELTALERQRDASKVVPPSYSGQDLIDKLTDIEEKKLQLQSEINAVKGNTDLLGIPVENTVLELKISGLDKLKDDILRSLRTSLLQSANEVSTLHNNTSDGQLRGLLNELDIHKTILMMNINDLKELHLEIIGKLDKGASGPSEDTQEDEFLRNNDSDNETLGQQEEFSTPESGIINPESNPSFQTHSSEIIQKITEIREAETDEPEIYCDQDSHELATVCEEDEPQNDQLVMEQELLKVELCRLEQERDELLEQIQNMNEVKKDAAKEVHHEELHNNFMREQSSEEVQKLPLDDATNQMFVNEEQLLAQRIRELEEDNERIRRNLSVMMEEAHVEKGDMEALMEKGEKLAGDEES